MTPKNDVDVDVVFEFLKADELGQLFWIKSPARHILIGQKAGYMSPNGYIKISLQGRSHLAHRLVWVLSNKRWPTLILDHIDGNRSNNSLKNLREVGYAENSQNMRVRNRNNCGAQGVYKRTDISGINVWQASIKSNNKKIYLGGFATKDEAHQAYLLAKKKLHPSDEYIKKSHVETLYGASHE